MRLRLACLLQGLPLLLCCAFRISVRLTHIYILRVWGSLTLGLSLRGSLTVTLGISWGAHIYITTVRLTHAWAIIKLWKCLGGLTVQAHCLSEYSHYPSPQLSAQLFPNRRFILWLALENGNGGARARNYCWRDIPTCTVRSLVWCLLVSSSI